jgi:hypothetical protein
VRLIDDQVGIALGEYLVHSIDQRAEWPSRSIHTIHALDRNKHATLALLERYKFGPDRPDRAHHFARMGGGIAMRTLCRGPKRGWLCRRVMCRLSAVRTRRSLNWH